MIDARDGAFDSIDCGPGTDTSTPIPAISRRTARSRPIATATAT